MKVHSEKETKSKKASGSNSFSKRGIYRGNQKDFSLFSAGLL